MADSKVNPAIFRAYDIRGLVGEDLDPERMELFGKAFARYVISMGAKKIAVGCDNRESSPSLTGALIRGLAWSGLDVVNVGEITTPCILFACAHLKIRAGLVVSASHNPAKYNGVKFVMDGRDRGGETIETVRDFALAGNFERGVRRGKVVKKNIFRSYLAALAAGLRPKKKLKVAVDCGNGVVGKFIVPYLKKLGHVVVPINCKSDPNYPNHPPDTVKPEYYPQLIAAVRAKKCDLGLMFDADGDRIAGVDEAGKIVWADGFLILYARDLLGKNAGAKVVVEIKCSQSVLDDIKAHGGVPILWKTGRTKIEDKMFEEGAVLAGEMSGHMFFVLPDGRTWLSESLYAAGRICRIVSESGKKLSELLSDIPKYHSTQEFRFAYTGTPEEKKFELMDRIVADFKEEWGSRVLGIDGARVDFGYGWGLVRVSNGEPVFSMRFEGRTEVELKRIVAVFRERLVRYPEIAADL
ncbi:MAG: phosphomannomutase/phosphoglucomutase [archaeon]